MKDVRRVLVVAAGRAAGLTLHVFAMHRVGRLRVSLVGSDDPPSAVAGSRGDPRGRRGGREHSTGDDQDPGSGADGPLPWSRWHWIVVIGLGTVRILDGLEVTVVGSVAGRLSERGSGLAISSAQVSGLAASLYVAGACVASAPLFGHLTDRFGRKKLFMVTLVVYLFATLMTAFSFAPRWFFLFRFVTGMGTGGEYAAINSAIDELIPKQHRERIDTIINGTFGPALPWAHSSR